MARSDPREIAQLCDRITEVMETEFPSLSPADCAFACSVVTYSYCQRFDETINKLRQRPPHG